MGFDDISTTTEATHRSGLEIEEESMEIPLLLSTDLDPNIVTQNLPYHNSSGSEGKNDRSPVPVTILSGFLGSGKTTLLQCILQSTTLGRRIAIIENEISGIRPDQGRLPSGALNIESLILRDGVKHENVSDLIELPNGCICCTVKDSLVATLEMLLQKKHDIDYIIIECSGMANPGPIASVFWLDDALQSQLKLDGILTVVDARNFEMQIKETSSGEKYVDHSKLGEVAEQRGDEAALQVAYADRIIINKVDLLEYDDQDMLTRKIDSIKDMIRSINSTAPIRITTFSQIFDLNWLLDTGSFSLERFCHNPVASSIINSCICNLSVCGLCSEAAIADSSVISPPHSHTSSIKTVVIIQDGSAYLSKVKSWLATILWPDQDMGSTSERHLFANDPAQVRAQGCMKIFRIKGLLSINLKSPRDSHNQSQLDEEDLVFVDEEGFDRRRYIVQAVNDIWDIQPGSLDLCWESGGIRLCKIVIIGRLLDEEILRSGFLSCML